MKKKKATTKVRQRREKQEMGKKNEDIWKYILETSKYIISHSERDVQLEKIHLRHNVSTEAT